MTYKIGQRIKMTKDAIENYGNEYEYKTFTISHISTKYMPAKEFFEKNKPIGYHPGYDESENGMPLYDFNELTFSLYDWEVTKD